MKNSQIVFIDSCISLGLQSPVKRSDLLKAAPACGMKYAPAWIVKDESRRVKHGTFAVPEIAERCDAAVVELNHTVAAAPVAAAPAPVAAPVAAAPVPVASDVLGMTGGQSESLVPTKMDTFEPFGFFKDLKKILTSRLFAPVYITGDTGNGKTTMIEQACAQLGRELYRVNITAQTDEDDLLGGFRLINGETVWSDGPVVRAMKSGAILLLDEIDYGSELMSCLQSVLEGKGVFLKKIGQFVKPAAGFNILATANTKGKGSESGRFANTNVLNEAFLDRFDWTVENDYPTEAIEKKILKANMNKFGKMDEDFAAQLTVWAGHVRKAFKEEAIDDNISTRRLVNICKAFSIFGEREEAVKMSLTRFSEESATELWRLYTKVDANAVNNVEEGGTTDDCPFE